MNLFRWFKKRVPQARPFYRPTRCGTPFIRNGGILLAYTDNVVTIIRKTAEPPKAQQQPDELQAAPAFPKGASLAIPGDA